MLVSCASQNYNINDSKFKIAKTDSVDIYYIFNIDNEKQSIIIGEKEYLRSCLPFKKYIFKDSIKQTTDIKVGSRKVFIGANDFEINDKKVKNSGELVKYIDNCDSFSD